MNRFALIYGNSPLFSHNEALQFIPDITYLNDKVGIFVFDSTPIDIFYKLGGSVRLCEILTESDCIDPEIIEKNILKTGLNIRFSVMYLDNVWKNERKIMEQVKNKLKNTGKHTQYCINKHNKLMPSQIVCESHIQEFLIIGFNNKYLTMKVIAVQKADDWSNRDYGRPYADAKSGMLPLKVARMAINIAVGGKLEQNILDPFMGMGTVLGEALITGHSISGMDLVQDSVFKARENIKWIMEANKLNYIKIGKLIQGDAVHASQFFNDILFDCIVTEPYLGPSWIGEGKGDKQKIKNIARGLERLYLGCLKNWKGILKENGKIMISLPEYHIGDTIISVKKTIDTCEKLGYTKLLGPIEYSRPQAVVRREFYLLKRG